MRAPFKRAIAAVLLGLTAACAPPGSPYYHTHNGVLLGAAGGALIGHDLHPTGGAATGALAGALIGGAIGNDMDWRERRYDGERAYYRYDDDSYTPPPPRHYRRYYRSSPYDDGY